MAYSYFIQCIPSATLLSVKSRSSVCYQYYELFLGCQTVLSADRQCPQRRLGQDAANGDIGGAGGNVAGGAIWNSGSRFDDDPASYTGNKALAGPGGPATTAAAGGTATANASGKATSGAGGSAITGNGGNGAAGGVAWGGVIFNSGDTFSEDDGVFGGAAAGSLATGGDGGNAGVVGTPGTGELRSHAIRPRLRSGRCCRRSRRRQRRNRRCRFRRRHLQFRLSLRRRSVQLHW